MYLLKLSVNVKGVQEVASPNATARMVLFDGICEGECFSGSILPGGVDTQIEYPDGSGTLSARYMIKGTDADGNPACLFVENSARLGESDTAPHILTDQPSLRWLESEKLAGRIISDNGELIILIGKAGDELSL